MNDVTAKSLLIQLQCTNKDITEAQNDALSYVISFLDEIKNKADRGNYGNEKKIIQKACPNYSDKEVEFKKKMDIIRDSLDNIENYFDTYAETIRQINACGGRCTDITEVKYYIDKIKEITREV